MHEIVIPATEKFNPETMHFESIGQDYHLHLEHSLASISKWEQKWNKPFLHTKQTYEETCDYIRCMTLDEDIPEEVYQFIPNEAINSVNEYINSRQTATWFGKSDSVERPEGMSKKTEIITSEIVYYWMIELGIPFECQYWHYNRLITLIKVVEKKREESDPNKKKKSQREINDAHRAALKANRAAMRKGRK